MYISRLADHIHRLTQHDPLAALSIACGCRTVTGFDPEVLLETSLILLRSTIYIPFEASAVTIVKGYNPPYYIVVFFIFFSIIPILAHFSPGDVGRTLGWVVVRPVKSCCRLEMVVSQNWE